MIAVPLWYYEKSTFIRSVKVPYTEAIIIAAQRRVLGSLAAAQILDSHCQRSGLSSAGNSGSWR